jgi:hypothetical protein
MTNVIDFFAVKRVIKTKIIPKAKLKVAKPLPTTRIPLPLYIY